MLMVTSHFNIVLIIRSVIIILYHLAVIISAPPLSIFLFLGLLGLKLALFLTRLTVVIVSVHATLVRQDTLKVEHLIAGALADDQLLLGLDQVLAYLANWRVHVILGPVVHSQA